MRTAVVTAAWLVVQALVGLLGLKGRRPYKAVIVVIHVVVAVFIAAGWFYTVSGLSAVTGNHVGSWIAQTVMGLAVVSLLVAGVILTAGRKVPAPKGLVLAHHAGTAIAAAGSLAGIVCMLAGV